LELIKSGEINVPIVQIEGKCYLVGIKTLNLELSSKNETVLARVGGGYEMLVSYYKKHEKSNQMGIAVRMLTNN